MNKSKSIKKRIRNEICKLAWENLKGRYDMNTIADSLNIPLATYWRAVNEHRQEK